MGLSSELASQFAKVTNDTSRNTNGTKLYGTITMLGEVPYVKLDGTEELTPISRTVEVAEGDRVEVMIANHSATVTGNLTDPSIGIMRAGALESSITQTAAEIRLALSDEVNKLNSSLTLTASEIRSELSDGISGLDSKITQNANSISMLVKNDEEFSEFQQTVEGFSFMGTGGTVKISGGDINLTGSITFSDFNQEVTDQMDSIESTADSALDLANTALSTANTAISDASDAYDAASSAKSVAKSIANGSYLSGTFINGTTISSPEIEGNNIKVYGTFQTVGNDEVGQMVTGYMGAAQGLDASGKVTYGVAIARTWNSSDYNVSDSYVIVTNAGVRLQFAGNSVSVTSGGIWMDTSGTAKAYYNNKEIGSGSSVTAVWG